MKKSLSLGIKLGTCLGALGLLLLVTSVVSVTSTSTLHTEMIEMGGRTATRLELALSLQKHLKALEAHAREVILAGFGHDQQAFQAASALLKKEQEEFAKLVGELEPLLKTEQGRRELSEILTSEKSWAAVTAEVVRLVDDGKMIEAAALAKEQATPHAATADRLLASLVARQHTFLQEAVAEGESTYAMTWWISASLSILSVLLTAFVTHVVRGVTRTLKGTVRDLGRGAEQVTAAAGEVSGASQTLSRGATEQAASLEETSASMEEMASMTRKNAENSQQAASMMAETERLVQGANGALTEMVTSMGAIKESSDKVAKIIKTIDEIAFQTNILALNAAVEAARAGEAGMGFAVVADEVRALAQRSAQAARDTAGLIEESIGKSNEGQQKVHLVTGAIESITGSTVKVKRLIDEVSEASRQQAQGIDQVSQAIAQMEKVTQGTAATAEESAAASEELNAQAESSLHVIARLQALVGGASAAAPAVPSAAAAAPKVRGGAATARKVVTMPRTRKGEPPAGLSPEEQIPLGDTGTYGTF